jgi:hypothetical protein
LALQRNLLKKADFWRYSDVEFWSRLVNSPDADVRAAASKVRPDLDVQIVDGEEPEGGSLEGEGEVIRKQFKVRTLDPDVLVAPGQTKQLSELDLDYKIMRESYIAARMKPLK